MRVVFIIIAGEKGKLLITTVKIALIKRLLAARKYLVIICVGQRKTHPDHRKRSPKERNAGRRVLVVVQVAISCAP